MKEFEQFRFIHSGIEYLFKWAKRNQIIEQMPPELASKINEYFNLVLSGNIPNDIFNNPVIQRCSKFRIKHLKRGTQPKIAQNLIEQGKIMPFSCNMKTPSMELNNFLPLLEITQTTFQEYEKLGYVDYKPSHDEVLARILLSYDNALSTEVPVWTRKKSTLEQFIVVDEPSTAFSCDFIHSLTGHIDLLIWDSTLNCFIVADYKPEGHFLRSLPQVAIYALILQKNLHLDQIMCISFNKDEGWLYNPHLLYTDIEMNLKENGNPPLKWRRIARSFKK